jgi:archaellum component FlaG (FlaF/FlaG flagellin family)
VTICKTICGPDPASPSPGPAPTSGGFIQSESESLETNFTALSNDTYQDIISIEMTTGDSDLLIWFNAVANIPQTSPPADPGAFRVLIDGSFVALERGLFTSLLEDRAASVSASTKVPISAGPHTIVLQLNPDGNTWTIPAATTPTVYGADLTVIEVAA